MKRVLHTLALLALALPALCSAAGRAGSPESTAGQPRSKAIYPEPRIALRFGHAEHIKGGAKCAACHAKAKESRSPADRILPPEAKCAACHEIAAAAAGKPTDPPSACVVCHPGFDFTVQQAPPASEFPRAAIRFSHAAHLERGAECRTCHGDFVGTEVVLATPAQLPRMATCLSCHDGREAPAACSTCHLGVGGAEAVASGFRIETHLPGGTLKPGPDDPFGLDHGPRFEKNHGLIAMARGEACSACHAQKFCLACHDGTTKPQQIHPGDWLAIHPVAAKQDSPRCDACHRRQSFCVACHERTGVGANADAPYKQPNVRVHPPTEIWVGRADLSGLGPGHHGQAAVRNIASCASCHREDQCLQCHSGIGGKVDPVPPFGPGNEPHMPVHPPGFAAGCKSMVQRNAQSCRKCHTLAKPDPIAQCF